MDVLQTPQKMTVLQLRIISFLLLLPILLNLAPSLGAALGAWAILFFVPSIAIQTGIAGPWYIILIWISINIVAVRYLFKNNQEGMVLALVIAGLYVAYSAAFIFYKSLAINQILLVRVSGGISTFSLVTNSIIFLILLLKLRIKSFITNQEKKPIFIKHIGILSLIAIGTYVIMATSIATTVFELSTEDKTGAALTEIVKQKSWEETRLYNATTTYSNSEYGFQLTNLKRCSMIGERQNSSSKTGLSFHCANSDYNLFSITIGPPYKNLEEMLKDKLRYITMPEHISDVQINGVPALHVTQQFTQPSGAVNYSTYPFFINNFIIMNKDYSFYFQKLSSLTNSDRDFEDIVNSLVFTK